MKRRTLLQSSLAAGLLGVAAGAGLLRPTTVWAAWPQSAFAAGSVEQALQHLAGATQLEQSDVVRLKAPPIAENGAVVNVLASAKISGVEAITLLVENNQTPLVVSAQFSPQMRPYLKTRLKMAKTGNVIAVVHANGKLYSARRKVKVTMGGCGG